MNGLLLIDKPQDMTSHDVVAQLRRILRQKAIGHTGTLDPLATGLMVMVLGDATKLSDYLTSEDKAYLARVKFGVRTDTLDRSGQVLSETPCDLHPELIAAAVARLQGEFEWPVPLFSAAKIEGKKLYEHGRQGSTVELPIKKMKFWGAKVEKCGSSWVETHLNCSKGSFIRTWAAQLGDALQVGGIIEELRRTRVGIWQLEKAVTLQSLEASGGNMGSAFIPIGQALPGLKAVMATPKEIKLVGNGQIPRDMGNRLIVEQKQAFELGRPVFVKVVSDTGDLLAILAAEPGQGLKIKRVFRALT